MQAPKGCSTWNDGDVRVIEYRWRGHGIAAPFFGLFGLMMLFGGYLTFERNAGGALAWMLFAMGGPAVYWATARWFNRTVVRVGPERVVFHAGPVPGFGNTSVATGTITGVRLQVTISSNRKGGSSRTYSIWTKQADENEAKLSRGLLTATWLAEDAEFIHRELEAALVEVRPE